MVRQSIKTVTYSTNRNRKTYQDGNKLRRAAAMLKGRMGSIPRAPLATRGFRSYRYGRGGGAELKFIDTTGQNIAMNNAGSVIPLNLLATGTDINGRVGRQITMKKLYFSYSVFNPIANNSAAPNGVFYKISLIYDCQNNSVNTVVPYNTIFSINHPMSPLNLSNRDRFRVLKEYRGQLSPYTISATGQLATGDPDMSFRNSYLKINLQSIFSGTGATLGDISTGSVLLCFVTDETPDRAILDYYCRIRFIDN